MAVYPQRVRGKLTGRWLIEVDYTVDDPAHPGRKLRKRHREVFAGNEAKARRRNAEIIKGGEAQAGPAVLARLAGPNHDLKTLAELCLTSEYTGLEARYLQTQRTYMLRFVAWLLSTSTPVSSVTDATMLGWRGYVSEHFAASPSGVNQHMTAALKFLGYLVKARLLPSVPKGARLSPKRVKMRRPLSSMAEASAFVQALRDVGYPGVADITAAAILTGLRRGNLLELRPEWIKGDDEGGFTLSIPRTKTGGRMVVPLPQAVAHMLQASLPWDPKRVTVEKIREGYAKAREKLGWTKENDLHFTFHGTRHTYGTWLMESGVDARVIQSLMGHSSIRTTQGYLTVAAGLKREANSRIDTGELLGGGK